LGRDGDLRPVAGRTGLGRRNRHALGKPPAADRAVDHRPCCAGRGRGGDRHLRRRHRHERDRLGHAAGPGHPLRAVDRLRRLDLLPRLLRLRRRRGDRLMSASETRREGWELPVAQGLAEPVMLAGMPRDYAILMGTLALILGLGLRLWWLGLAWWAIAHAIGLY